MDEDTFFLKVIVVGDSAVGKTSLLNQYCYEKFENTVQPTVGCDFCTKVITNYKQKTIRMQLWDVAGQERFKNLLKMYVRGSLGCVIVTDTTVPESLESALDWKRVVMEQADPLQDGGPIPFVLFDNKSDLLPREKIKDKAMFLENYVKTNGIAKGFMTSAKENINLNEAFEYLAKVILERHLDKKGVFPKSLPDSTTPTPVTIKSKSDSKKTKNNECC